jgi:hypothetical protein
MEEEPKDDEMISDEGIRKNPFPFWLWLFFIAIMVFVLSIVQRWYTVQVAAMKEDTPFFDVTNRQFSLFLWENPRFMRVNVSSKDAYLPGFQYLEKVTPHPELADQLVQAPPEILFHYHTWKRLIGDEISPRVITPEEFSTFLESSTEWEPQNWPEAPAGYIKLVDSLSSTTVADLYSLPMQVFPLNVRLAFIGWMNYYKEGEEINALVPTYEQLDGFLEKNPTFKRNYWRNIVHESDPNYLENYTFNHPSEATTLVKGQMTPFLRVALFNYIKSEAKQKPSS